MKFFIFLISDKRGLKYFKAIGIPIFLYSILLLFTGNSLEEALVVLVLVSIPILFYVGFYGSSYLNYMKQQKFKEFYNGMTEQTEIKSLMLHQKGFTLRDPRSNYPAKIIAEPREVSYQLITIHGETVLLCYVYDLSRFRRYLPPLHLTDTNPSQEIKHTKPIPVTVRSNGDETEVHFLRGEYGIVKLVYT